MSLASKLGESELNLVTGGSGDWQQGAGGDYKSYGGYIVYTAAAGDTPAAIAARFGVREEELRQWNQLTGGTLAAGEKLTVYARLLR